MGGERKDAGKPARTVIKRFDFASKGTHRYAIEVQQASNGNPVLELKQLVRRKDGGTFEASVNVWSEDFDTFFKTLGDVYRFMKAEDIKTPADHVTPKAGARGRGGQEGRGGHGGREANRAASG
ncbi:MAG: hypothetical protein KAS72_04420 [Phycisphaerales bacterium]|nr:hypothetical protein [Phycisphaerales bacterium]